MNANKNKIFFFYLRSFAFSVSFKVGGGQTNIQPATAARRSFDAFICK
jgi:hypothetical protein